MTANHEEMHQLRVRAAKTILNITAALELVGEQARIAAENMDALTKAHYLAEDRGIGVIAIREADGSLDCQPNVFVAARQVIIMEPTDVPPPALDFPDAPDPVLRAELTHLATRIIRPLDTGLAA